VVTKKSSKALDDKKSLRVVAKEFDVGVETVRRCLIWRRSDQGRIPHGQTKIQQQGRAEWCGRMDAFFDQLEQSK
jgi:hypothetical protein